MIALPCLLYSMDLTVLNLALPAISADLRPTSAQLLWIVDIYGFLVAGLLITMGALGDRIGRRRLLLIGAAGFGVASVLAAFSISAEMLIATRAALGIAGATPGGAIGPLVGGVLLEHFWWGSVFLAGVPVMSLLLAVGPALLPEFRDPEAGRPDLASAALSLAAVLPVIYGIKRIAEGGAAWLPLLCILAGLAAGAVFVQRQHRLADPLIDLRLFRAPAFSASLATYTLGTFVAFGSFLFIAQYLQRVLGLSPLQAGVWMLPFFVGWISGSMLVPLMARRIRTAFALSTGLALAAIGFGVLTRVDGSSALAVLVTGSLLVSLGLAPVFTLTTDVIVGAAPPERAGAASAISETGSELGGALGIALLGSLATAVYGREALTQGLQLTAAISAAVVLATAIVAAVVLREVRTA